jgi:hypothetical protein
MRLLSTSGAMLTLVFVATACGPRTDRGAAGDTSVTDTRAPTVPPKAVMAAMPMLPKLRAHLDSVAAHPAMLKRGMADHEAEITAVVDAMHADMMSVGMPSDAAYEALADSVVKGSAALGTASGPDFDQLVMQHVDQVRRLAAVYESKVGTR